VESRKRGGEKREGKKIVDMRGGRKISPFARASRKKKKGKGAREKDPDAEYNSWGK